MPIFGSQPPIKSKTHKHYKPLAHPSFCERTTHSGSKTEDIGKKSIVEYISST